MAPLEPLDALSKAPVSTPGSSSFAPTDSPETNPLQTPLIIVSTGAGFFLLVAIICWRIAYTLQCELDDTRQALRQMRLDRNEQFAEARRCSQRFLRQEMLFGKHPHHVPGQPMMWEQPVSSNLAVSEPTDRDVSRHRPNGVEFGERRVGLGIGLAQEDEQTFVVGRDSSEEEREEIEMRSYPGTSNTAAPNATNHLQTESADDQDEPGSAKTFDTIIRDPDTGERAISDRPPRISVHFDGRPVLTRASDCYSLETDPDAESPKGTRWEGEIAPGGYPYKHLARDPVTMEPILVDTVPNKPLTRSNAVCIKPSRMPDY